MTPAETNAVVEDYLDIAQRTRWTLTTYLGRGHGRTHSNPHSAMRAAAEKELARRHQAGELVAVDSALPVKRPAYLRADICPF